MQSGTRAPGAGVRRQAGQDAWRQHTVWTTAALLNDATEFAAYICLSVRVGAHESRKAE